MNSPLLSPRLFQSFLTRSMLKRLFGCKSNMVDSEIVNNAVALASHALLPFLRISIYIKETFGRSLGIRRNQKAKDRERNVHPNENQHDQLDYSCFVAPKRGWA